MQIDRSTYIHLYSLIASMSMGPYLSFIKLSVFYLSFRWSVPPFLRFPPNQPRIRTSSERNFASHMTFSSSCSFFLLLLTKYEIASCESKPYETLYEKDNPLSFPYCSFSFICWTYITIFFPICQYVF